MTDYTGQIISGGPPRSDDGWGMSGIRPNVPAHERSPGEQQILARYQQEEAAKAKREADHLAAEGSRWQRFRQKIRREVQEHDEAEARDAATLAAMPLPQQLAHYSRHPPDPHERVGYLPKLANIALDDDRRERVKAENVAREQAEQAAGLPQAEAAWQKRVEGFRKERIEAEGEAEKAKQAAREREQEQLDRLGPCPTLDSLEAVPA